MEEENITVEESRRRLSKLLGDASRKAGYEPFVRTLHWTKEEKEYWDNYLNELKRFEEWSREQISKDRRKIYSERVAA